MGAARDMLAGDLGDAPALGLAQIGELPGAAAGEDDVHPAFDHPIDVALQRAFIDAVPVLCEWRDDRNAHSLEVLHRRSPDFAEPVPAGPAAYEYRGTILAEGEIHVDKPNTRFG